MELNNLLAKIGHQEEEPKTFLAIELTDDFIQTAVWQVRDGRTEVVRLGSAERWDGTDPANLAEQLDKSFSKATESLSQEPNEVVFGLPDDWVNDEGIVDDKKELIKEACKELAFKPLGFVVLMESLVKYLKIREGTPATAIILRLEDTNLAVSLVKLGHITETQVVGRSEDIAHDAEEAISRFNTEDNLPSRIIVFNGTQDMAEVVQNLTSYDWQSKFNFLHLPKIEALPKDAGISAVAVAGGSEVARSIGFEVTFDQEEKKESQESAKEQETEEKISQDDPNNNLKAIGFVEGQDIRKTPPVVQDQKIAPKPEEEPVKAPPVKKASMLGGLTSSLKSVKFPTLSFPRKLIGKVPKGPITVIVLGLLAVLIGVYALLWFVPKTEAVIFVEPRNLDQSLTLTIDQSATEPNLETNTIPGSVVSHTIQAEESKDTTGSSLVGDPATGTVTVYNRTSLQKTFEEGTIISSGALDFTLDQDVTIASGSASNEYVGKANVSITADQIGEESNLPSNTEFVVDGFSTSSYVARNESALSGGTAEEVRTVSEDDLDALIESLTQRLQKQAEEELSKNASEQTGVFIQADLTQVENLEFSHEEGDQTNTVSLNLTIQARGLSYNKEHIEPLITENIGGSIPDGYERADLPVEVVTESAEEGDDGITLDSTVKVKLLPKVDKEALAQTIKAKPTDQLEEIFKTIPNFKRAEVSIQPQRLPPRWKKVSRNPKNISIEIKPTESN